MEPEQNRNKQLISTSGRSQRSASQSANAVLHGFEKRFLRHIFIFIYFNSTPLYVPVLFIVNQALADSANHLSIVGGKVWVENLLKTFLPSYRASFFQFTYRVFPETRHYWVYCTEFNEDG